MSYLPNRMSHAVILNARKLAVLMLACFLMLQLWAPSASFGMTEDINSEADELQQRVESSAARYNAAVNRILDLELQMETIQIQIDELESRLPDQRARSSTVVAEYYRLSCTGNSFLEFIFSADSFGDFIAKCEYTVRIQNSYVSEMQRMKDLSAELNAARDALSVAWHEAIEEKTRAEEALREAQTAREEARERARRQAEAEAAAREKAEQEAAAREAENTASVPSSSAGSSLDDVNWSVDKSDFVNHWAGRIDAYLAGSPLAGQGRVFAEAAWDYGVDPRWSPAIAHVESSKGLYCFLPYNAWGWGYVTWPDWETAIRAHVRGLANGYGYTISIAAAQKYCPPNWEFWYNTTLAQMERI